jgi:hypothetical protein
MSIGGCECSYEMYDCQSSSRDRDIMTLQHGLNENIQGTPAKCWQ